jgi:hypothetical protein
MVDLKDKKTQSQLLVLIIVIALIIAGIVAAFLSTGDDSSKTRIESVPFIQINETLQVSMADSDYVEDPETGLITPHPDKLFDIEEIYIYGTNASNPDTDYDGMEDGWEAHYGVIDILTGRLTIDPNRADANENPDGDGWDANGNGYFDGDENLTNLEEYCGGSLNWGPFKGRDPTDADDLTYIRDHGGFHLIDWPKNYDNFDSLWTKYKLTVQFQQFFPDLDDPLTTNPSESDSDFDGMSDGFEIFFREECEYLKTISIYNELRTAQITYNYTLDPLNPNDAHLDMDVRKTDESLMGLSDDEFQMAKDGLNNIQEFQNGTNPTAWDTDDDTYYDVKTGRFHWMSDSDELNLRNYTYKPNIDWNKDGIVDYATCPYKQDTDSDYMEDGWEEFFGLTPVNASDRFLDLDGDGLQNFQEFAYPNITTVWFKTDPSDQDTDDDGMPDGWEAKANSRPISKRLNAPLDDDRADGLVDGIAYEFTVNPMLQDEELDLDGIWYDDPDDEDNRSVYHQDPDNLTNLLEFLSSANPMNPDSDGDGLTDGMETGYWYCVICEKTISWWLCEEDGGHLSMTKKCSEHGEVADTCPDCGSSIILHKGGFHGELISGYWITDPDVSALYFTNASDSNTDGDFGPGDEINASRYLDDWEEINGIQRELGDNMDNNGNAEEGSPTVWNDKNRNGFIDSDELSNYDIVTDAQNDKVTGGYKDGIDNDFDGQIDEGIDETDEGVTFTPVNASYYDTDHEGIGDVNEIFGVYTGEFIANDPTSGYGTVTTNPGREDTDSDYLNDYIEITRIPDHKNYVSDPNDDDSDDDTLSDGEEWDTDFYPLENYIKDDDIDANGDELTNDADNGQIVNGIKYLNYMDRTNPRLPDTDGDDLPDGWEFEYGKTRQLVYIQWHDTVFGSKWATSKQLVFVSGECQRDIWVINPVDQTDKYLDPDRDGLNNWKEYELGTDPLNSDSDHDGLPDGWEIQFRRWDYNVQSGLWNWNLDPSDGDTNKNDVWDDEDNDGNSDPTEEIFDNKDNDGDGELVSYIYVKGVKVGVQVKDGKDNDGDGRIDEPDEVSWRNWIDDDGDGTVDEGIDEEWDLNDANEDYDWDGLWYTIAWVDDDGDGKFDEDPIDDDGDGLINEDWVDEEDNDGDGLIDEDTGTELDDDDHDDLIDEDPKRYYHRYSNYFEYNYGVDYNGDGVKEMTTDPNEWSTDGDPMSDGWEVYMVDYPVNSSNPGRFEDNDSLPRWWEELFNGSLVIFPTDYNPAGLYSAPATYVGQFNPNDKDSNDNGIPDNVENPDKDQWDDPYDDYNGDGYIDEADRVQIPCNNTAEYRGHSDPTHPQSTPKPEYRSQNIDENDDTVTTDSLVYNSNPLEYSDVELIYMENRNTAVYNSKKY